jgi:protein-disulfide isomerase
MKRILAALALLTIFAATAQAQPAPSFTAEQRQEIVGIVRAALRSDPSILRDAITALQDEDGLKQEAVARAAIARAGDALAKTPGDPVAGNPNGDVTVVEFYDLRCPYCRRMLPVDAELLADDGKVRLVYKDIPILGPASLLGAKAVLAAQRQGGYQKLHDAIMRGTPTITEASLHEAADAVGLDWSRLQHDMADPAIRARIDANLELARSLGVDGTPAYVVGRKMLPGAVDLPALRDAVAATRGQE